MQTENRSQKIAVTGATGRLGAPLVEILEQLDQAGCRIEHGGSGSADGEATVRNGRRGVGGCLEDQRGDGPGYRDGPEEPEEEPDQGGDDHAPPGPFRW